MVATIDKQHERSKQFLAAALANGSCPYAFSRAKQPSLEATAWSTIALLDDISVIEQTAPFLIQNQNTDGGWPTTPGELSNWTTSPTLLALRYVKSAHPALNLTGLDAAIGNGIQWLMERRTDPQVPILRLLLLYLYGKGGLDGTGKGWAWTGNLYHWVEPTVYALMALKFPAPVDSDLVRQSIKNGNKYLLTHTCKDGGWNHGQFFCLGENLPGYILTTSESLIALLDDADHKKVKRAVEFLSSFKYEPYSAWSLAWSIIALSTYKQDYSRNLDMLLGLQHNNGSFGSNYLATAFSIIALNTVSGTNIFAPSPTTSQKR
jgi:hypothetical protein